MTRGKYFGWLAVLAIMTLPCLVSRVWAAQFSAELVINGPGQSGVFELQIRDDLYRLRKVKGFPMVPPFPFIVDRSTGLTWGLNPQLRQYMEISDPAKTALMNPLVGWVLTRRGYSEQPGSAETVNGYQCRTTIYREQGKSEIAAKVWFSDHLNHLVREERFGRNENPVMELKQIKEGPQAPDLFKIPPGYSKMEASGTSASKAKPSSLNPAPASPSKDESGTSGDIVFILDASGSMWGKLEGQSKIAIAKKVMSELIRDLPDDSNVGLVAYGHRRRGDCNDVEELVPLGPIDKKRLISTVQALSPKGKTPISRSIRLTAERLKHLEDQVTIILVSDGKETCDEDPCALVKSLKETSINFVMHVIGFNVTKDELAQLRCLAEAGGGVYYTAKSAKDFQVAAKEVVKKASEKPPVRLKVTCLKDENKIKAYVQILTQGGKKRVAEGWSDPERPALFRLPPGTYDVRAQDQSVIEQPTVELKNVEVVEGRITEVIANFAAEGILQVKAVKNDAPLKAYVRIHRQQDDKYMKDGWTGADGKPAQYKLLPGLYKVKVQDPSVIQRPVVVIENVEVKAGQTVERTAGFDQGGVLQVKAVKNDAPLKAYVRIYRQQDDKYMKDGWTGADGKPAQYKLLPGLYKVRVQDPSVIQSPVVVIENVEVKAGQTAERVAGFVEGGVLQVKAVKNDAPLKAYVRIHRQQDDKYLKDGWTSEGGKPPEYKLLPGLYKVRVQDRSNKERPEVVLENVEVRSGQTSSVKADLTKP